MRAYKLLNQQLIKKLDKNINNLRKACHHEGCPNIDGCPQYHEKCQARLNFKTAIMWELANDLRHIMHDSFVIDIPLTIIDYKYYKSQMIKIENLLDALDFLYNASRIHEEDYSFHVLIYEISGTIANFYDEYLKLSNHKITRSIRKLKATK